MSGSAIRAGVFADPLGGYTCTPAWRVVLVLTALRLRALARRCGVGPVPPRALATRALLDVLASLAGHPSDGPTLLVRTPASSSNSRVRPPAVELLADIRGVFECRRNLERIASAVLRPNAYAGTSRPYYRRCGSQP